MRRAGAVASAAVALAGVLAAGCGSSPPPSQATTGGYGTASGAPSTPASQFESIGQVSPTTAAGLQDAIVRQVTAHLPAGTAVTAACPSAPATAGGSVHCTVTIAGTAVDWQATNRDGTTIDSEPTVGLLALADARQAVAATFSDFARPTVDCGPGVVVVVKVDDELTCSISSGTREGSAHVVVTDRFGHFQVTP